MFFLCHATRQVVSVLTRSGEKLVVSPLLLCQGVGGVRILHQIGRFDEIARKIRQGWGFFEVRPNFASKLVDVQAQLASKLLSGIVTAQHFFSPNYLSMCYFLVTDAPTFRGTFQFTTSAWAMIYRARYEVWSCSDGHPNRGYYLSKCSTCNIDRAC